MPLFTASSTRWLTCSRSSSCCRSTSSLLSLIPTGSTPSRSVLSAALSGRSPYVPTRLPIPPADASPVPVPPCPSSFACSSTALAVSPLASSGGTASPSPPAVFAAQSEGTIKTSKKLVAEAVAPVTSPRLRWSSSAGADGLSPVARLSPPGSAAVGRSAVTLGGE